MLSYQPVFAVKANALGAAVGSVNAAGEFYLSDRLTLNLPVSYNPWTFSENKKWRHLAFQPEIRYWDCNPYNGLFFGLNLQYAVFNIGGVSVPFLSGSLKQERWQGNAYGAGATVGYQFLLSNRLNLETSLSGGFAHLDYETFRCETCGKKTGDATKNYFGPTNAVISLVYIIK